MINPQIAAPSAPPTAPLGRKAGVLASDRFEADILVVGSGFAGVFAALEARERGLSVVMVDKGSVGWSGLSPWASDTRPFDPQIYDRREWLDAVALHTEWLFDRRWMDIFCDESLGLFRTLQDWGCGKVRPFERWKIFRKRLNRAGVTLVERTMLTRLRKDAEGRVCGALGLRFDDSAGPVQVVRFAAKATILCTGAGTYKAPGFPAWGQTFDGDAMAYEAGAWIAGKEFHDTHPTYSDFPAASYDGWEWAQEVRGSVICVGPPIPLLGGLTLDGALLADEGAFTRQPGGGFAGEPPVTASGPPPLPPPAEANRKYLGKGFLQDLDAELDLGGPPAGLRRRDMGYRVGGATAGMGVHKGEGVFNSDYTCAADGVPGLFAAGDALASGMCGPLYAGRGFSSYGSAIQGRRAAGFACDHAAQIAGHCADSEGDTAAVTAVLAPLGRDTGFSPHWATQVLQATMTPLQVLYIKSARRLEGALAQLEYLRDTVAPRLVAGNGHELRVGIEFRNMLLNAEMKLRAGLFRTESRGTHFREDYPFRDDANWFCNVVMRKGEGGMILEKRTLPDAWRPPAELSYRQRYPRVWPGENAYLARNGNKEMA